MTSTRKQSIEVGAAALKRLLTPILPIAGTDPVLPILTGIRLEVRDGWLTAAATDRYRAAIARIPAPEKKPYGEFTALVAAKQLRQVLRIFAPYRRVPEWLTLRLTTDGETFTVELLIEAGAFARGTQLRFTQITGQFPNIVSVIAGAVTGAPNLTTPMGLNPRLLASFADVAERNTPVTVWGSSASKPIVVAAGDHFIGLLMPIRLKHDADGAPTLEPATEIADAWATVLAPTEPAKSESAA